MRESPWSKYFLIAAALLIGTYYMGSAHEPETLSPQPMTQVAELKVVASSQNSDGAQETQFNPETAQRMEAYAVERIRAKLVALGKQEGVSLPPPSIYSESVVTELFGRKLIVIRTTINESSKGVEVIGIRGARLDRVVCARDSLDDILITVGPCSDKLKEVFGNKNP